MYEDSPPELIHDDLSEVVFGEHPLGRPIIGHSETPRAPRPADGARLPRRALREPGHRGRRPAGNVDHDHLCELTAAHFRPEPGAVVARPELQRARLPPRGALLAEGHRAVPRLPRRSRAAARRPGPLRRLRRRHDPRRLLELAPLPGGAREARPRLLRLLVHLAVRRRRPHGHLRRLARGGRGGGDGRHPRRARRLRRGHRRRGHRSAPRTTSRVSSCSAWRAPAAACSRSAGPSSWSSPCSRVDEVLARIDAVTHDDVMAAVRRYYDPEKWSTVCIGPRPEPFRAVTDGFDWEER